MLKKIFKNIHAWQTKFSFGSTSAIITNLALMAGLHSETNAKVSIIGGILVIAIADNIADSFGIHIYQECERRDRLEVWTSTVLNFLSRLLVSFSFIAIILLLPLNIAICSSIAWGLTLMAGLSYLIAKNESGNPFASVMTHVFIAIFVIALSNIVGDYLIRNFGR